MTPGLAGHTHPSAATLTMRLPGTVCQGPGQSTPTQLRLAHTALNRNRRAGRRVVIDRLARPRHPHEVIRPSQQLPKGGAEDAVTDFRR